MRQTSIDAWKRINDEGLVGPFQLDVYNIFYNHGPITAGQAWSHYKVQHPNTQRGRNEVAKRVSELQTLGVMKETGMKTTCPVTGFEAMLWDVTENIPRKEDNKGPYAGPWFYVSQERAMAPGCSGEWPDIIPHPTSPNGRLVRMSAAQCHKIDRLCK